MVRFSSFLFFVLITLTFSLALVACGTTGGLTHKQQALGINPQFQKQLSPVPTISPYKCGAWSSNNVPGANSTITIYAKLTQDLNGVANIPANAIVHFRSGDAPVGQQALTDNKGYVSFSLPLGGRQPRMQPTTVDVTFNVRGTLVQCSAFFTPQ